MTKLTMEEKQQLIRMALAKVGIIFNSAICFSIFFQKNAKEKL